MFYWSQMKTAWNAPSVDFIVALPPLLSGWRGCNLKSAKFPERLIEPKPTPVIFTHEQRFHLFSRGSFWWNITKSTSAGPLYLGLYQRVPRQKIQWRGDPLTGQSVLTYLLNFVLILSTGVYLLQRFDPNFILLLAWHPLLVGWHLKQYFFFCFELVDDAYLTQSNSL